MFARQKYYRSLDYTRKLAEKIECLARAGHCYVAVTDYAWLVIVVW